MRAVWNPGDLPIGKRSGHLRIVTSGERADSLGAGRALSPGVPVPLSPAEAPAYLFTKVLPRAEEAVRDLRQACLTGNQFDLIEAARALQHIGLLAGDKSREMERAL